MTSTPLSLNVFALGFYLIHRILSLTIINRITIRSLSLIISIYFLFDVHLNSLNKSKLKVLEKFQVELKFKGGKNAKIQRGKNAKNFLILLVSFVKQIHIRLACS